MFSRLIENIAAKLNKSGLPYMVIGGQAVLLYGEPRLTRDIDITLGVGVGELKQVMDLVGELKLKVLVENPSKFVEEFMVLPVIDTESSIKVDFIFSFTPYEAQAIKRVKKIKFGREKVNFASIEDTIIHKIFAARPRDLEDVKNILLKNTDYDIVYIEKWLSDFDKSLNENCLERFKKILLETK